VFNQAMFKLYLPDRNLWALETLHDMPSLFICFPLFWYGILCVFV